MVGNRSHFQFSKSVVARSLILLGILILGGNLTAAADEFSRTVGWNSADAQSVGPVALLALGVPRAFQDFLRSWSQVLLSLWPLLFVIAGAALLRIDFARHAENRKNKSADMSISHPVVRR